MSEQIVEDITPEKFEPATLAVTYKEGVPPVKSVRHVSGTTLRREYLYEQRANYIFEQGPEYIWSVEDEQRLYPQWKKEAEIMYPNEGDYLVEVVDKTDGKSKAEAKDVVTFIGVR